MELIDTQVEIESIYSRRNIRSKVKEDLEGNLELIDALIDSINKYRAGKYYDSKQLRVKNLSLTSEEIAQEILIAVLNTKIKTPIQAVATQIAQQLGYSNLLDGVKTASELLAACEVSKIYTIYSSFDGSNPTGTLALCSHWALEPHTQAFIEKTKYLPPMVTKPVPWTSNSQGGYLNGSGSLILGFLNHHEQYQARDVLNMLQDIEWTICDMVDYVEKSKKPLDTGEKAKQFNKLVDDSLVVYNELMEHGNRFYFVWKYDKRGRMYSQGYHCNLQSTEYKKAILEFAKEEVIK